MRQPCEYGSRNSREYFDVVSEPRLLTHVLHPTEKNHRPPILPTSLQMTFVSSTIHSARAVLQHPSRLGALVHTHLIGFELVLYPLEQHHSPPIQSRVPGTVVLVDVSSRLLSALTFPPWVGDVFRIAGFSIFLIGVMAWLTSYGAGGRLWGRRITLSGITIIILGFAFTTVIDLLRYVLS